MMSKLAVVAAVAIVSPASAGVVLTIEEVGLDVVISGGGTLDVSLWGTGPLVGGSEGVLSPNVTALVGPDSPTDLYLEPTNFAGPSGIGSGTDAYFQDNASGDTFGLQWLSVNTILTVPRDYVSGDPLNGTATIAGESFASIGLTLGSYTWTWDTVSGGSDFFTINVVPGPGAFAVFGIAGCCTSRRRRR